MRSFTRRSHAWSIFLALCSAHVAFRWRVVNSNLPPSSSKRNRAQSALSTITFSIRTTKDDGGTAKMISLAVLFLATIKLAVAQTTGSTSSCTGEQYTDKNGLNFYTDCPSDAGSSHANQTYFWSAYEDSAEDCMDSCGVARPICYAITYSNGICYEYDENLFPPNANGSRAIAVASQLAMPDEQALACPYDALSFQTVGSEQFQIICNQDFGGDGGDYCAYEEEPAKCPRHTETLEECMQFCSEAHPLCKGVSWNADLLDGFGNCYLKQHPEAPEDTTRATHSALITQKFYQDLSTACPATSPYEAGGNNYTVACKTGREDTQNTTSVHSDSLDACLEECSAPVVGKDCQGVLFDMSMLLGYDNCYLLNDTGSPSPGGANMTFAELTTSNKGSTGGGSGKDGGGGGSKAWIAGPVIGAVVLIAAVIGGVIWWRRRRARREASPQGRNDWEGATQGPGAPMIKEQYSGHQPIQGGEKSGEPAVRHEMSDPNSERLWPPEMNA